MTWLKAINVFFFQWLFVRLTKCRDIIIIEHILIDANSTGSIDLKNTEWYSIHFWILPLSGWWNDFIYLNKGKYFKISKSKIV